MSINFSLSIPDRIENAILLPFEAVGNGLFIATHTLLGAAGVAVESLTFGNVAASKTEVVSKWTRTSKDLINNSIYKPVLKVVNPSARFAMQTATISRVSDAVLLAARESSRYTTFFERHVLSRALLLTHIPLSVATRTADFALGVLGAAASIALLGTNAKVNGFAVAHLESTRLIHDICTDVRAIMSPNPLRILSL